MQQYKIVCITQIYNEIEKRNLERFFLYAKPLFDDLIIYDDASTDGSFEYACTQTPHVIRGAKNNFLQERYHKKLLLEKALSLSPDAIVYLDADEVLSAGAKEHLQLLAKECIDKNLDGLQFHKINLWRSATWQRVDSLFDIGWFTHFWRVTPDMRYQSIKPGLHQPPYPSTIKKIERTDKISVLHYGFADEKNLAYKYLLYKSYGQRGYDMLDRLIDEESLEVKRVEEGIFPGGKGVDRVKRVNELYVSEEGKPRKKTFVESLTYVEKYKPLVFRPKYSIVCLIYKSIDWLEFVYEQVLKYTDMKDKEFLFVANDATDEVLAFLKEKNIPHYVWNNSEKQRKEWYINNVYRAWNYGAKIAKGDFIVFINSDMAFSEGWLDRLIEKYDGKNCIASRLVESGKLKSGMYGIEKNFGRSIETYRENAFQSFVTNEVQRCKGTKVQADDLNLCTSVPLHPGGLFMPLLIRRDQFLSVKGYPEGNVVPGTNMFHPKIAKQGEPCLSGDVILMEKLKAKGIVHQTAFDSMVYHFQEGEMDSFNKEKKGQRRQRGQIAVVSEGLLVRLRKMMDGVSGEIHSQTKIVVQDGNVSVNKTLFTIVFIEQYDEVKKKILTDANMIVVDSIETAAKYRDYETTVIPFSRQYKSQWQKVFEQAFQTIRIHELRNMPYPTRKVSRIHVFREYAEIVKNKGLFLARRVKHRLVLP